MEIIASQLFHYIRLLGLFCCYWIIHLYVAYLLVWLILFLLSLFILIYWVMFYFTAPAIFLCTVLY